MMTDKQKVRKDIQTYENQKKVKRLAQLGTLAGLGTMGYGGYHGSKKLMTGGLLGTVLTSYGAGRAQRKRDQALGRIKRYYDLRDDKLVNLNAVLPTREDFKKHAVLGGVLEALTGAMSMPLSHMVQQAASHIPHITPYLSTAAGAAAPFAIDMAATPYLAKKMTQSGLGYAHVFAKQRLGKTLTPKEVKMMGSALKAQGRIQAANADTRRVIGPLRRYFTNFFSGPPGMGSQIGEQAGNVLKHVGEVSPRYQQMGLDAIHSEAARAKLLDAVKQDAAILNKGVEAAQDTRAAKILKRLGRGSAPSAKHIASELIENPHKLEEWVNKYKDVENRTAQGAKAIGAGTGAAIVSNMLGQMRSRHPLSKNELPTQLMPNAQKEKPSQKAK